MTAAAREKARATAPSPTAPSFVRGLFAGVVHDDLLFPFPPSLAVRNTSEAATVKRLIGTLHEMKASGLIDSERFDEEETIGDDVIRALAASGLLGLTIPKEFGGAGLSASGYARVFAELSATDPSLAVLVGVHCGLGSKAIVLYGDDRQKRRFLPRLATGEMLAAYALTEPNIGSDAQNIETRAERTAGGWSLSGRKIWIGNAHRAGVIVTFAQTPSVRSGRQTPRPTAFLVTPDMPGFEVAGTVRKLGIRGSTQAELVYRDVPVPDENVLGGVGRGFSVAVHVLNGGRLTLAAGCTGGAKRVLSEMQSYADQRIQFGHPLSEYEITQRKISTIASELYASEAMLGELAAMMDASTSDYSLETACAKVFASEMVWRAADEMVQIAGGRGFVKPYPYERMLRDARINRIFEGANEVLRLFIALNGIQGPAERLREVAGAIRRPMRNLGLLSGYAASRLRSAFRGTATLDVELPGSLREHARYFEKHTAELKSAAERAVVKHRKALVDRQLVLERLANMAIELFARACVIARTQRLLAEGDETDALALCDLFCVESGRRFREARNALDPRDEEVDEVRRYVAAGVRSAGGYPIPDALLDLDR